MYNDPAFPHLPTVNWTVATPIDDPTAAVPATREELNDMATNPSDLQLQVAAEGAPIREIYGNTVIGAQVADYLIQGTYLVVLAVWCGGPIQAINSFTLNDKAPSANVVYSHHLGTTNQTVDGLLVSAYTANGIPNFSDTFQGIAYSVIKIPTGEVSGVPSIKANISGRKIYDPRTNVYIYSTNPALALADFISNSTFGYGKSVDWASVAAVANYCDESVGGRPRREIGLCLDKVSECEQWFEVLRTYAACWINQTTAGLELIPDRPSNYEFEVGPADMVEGTLTVEKLGSRDRPNVMIIKWMDLTVTPAAERVAVAKTAAVLAGTIPPRESEIQMYGIHSSAQAMREAIERLNHFNLEDMICRWTGFDEAILMKVGTVIRVNHPIGIEGKLMRVTSLVNVSPGRWAVEAREYDPGFYSDHVEDEPTYLDTNLPDPAFPPAVTGLTVSEEVYQLDNGSYSSRLKISWNDADYPYLAHYKVVVKLNNELVASGQTSDTEFTTGTVKERVIYVVQVSAVTAIGATGTASQFNIVPAGKYLVPGDVPSVEAFEAGGNVYITWEPAVDIDILRYEVKYGVVGVNYSSAKLIDRVDSLRLTTNMIPVGTWDILVKALDSVGQASVNAYRTTVTVTSDAAAFLVASYSVSSPTLTNMVEYSLSRVDKNRYFVTEDGVSWNTKFPNAMNTYTNPLFTYHNAVTSTFLGESEDFGLLLGGQWTGTASLLALTGTVTSSIGFSTNGSTWTYKTGLSHKENSRFARIKHESLTTSTMLVTIPTQNIRVDAIPRKEVGSGVSNASGPITITLTNSYAAIKKITITPIGTTARSYTYDNLSVGAVSSFDVYIFDAAGNLMSSNFTYEFQGV